MFETVAVPLWLLILIVLFAAVTFASHFLFPSVRWFLRRRAERVIARLNERLTRPIEPFKLARRYDMIQRLIYDPEVSQAILEYAEQEGVREDVAFEKARTYAREIVPSFSAFAYFGFGIRAARWLATTLYTVQTGPKNGEVLANLPEDATVIFVMNHRSNMDYVLVTYLAGEEAALSYAVGEWARVWPLSRLIKSMGAYFIRRRSRGLLYRKVLARYIDLSTRGGVTQAIFPEGGLSLDGRLAAPKMGLLSYAVDTYRDDGPEIVFVPVAINYDRVLEDRILVQAGQNGTRRFQARISVILWFILRKLWLRVRGRFMRFGTAAVVYGDPVPISRYAADLRVERLATDLMHAIQDVMPVLAVPLLSRLLVTADGPLDAQALQDAFHGLMTTHPQFAGNPPPTPDASKAHLEAALQHLLQRRVISQTSDQWVVNPDDLPLLRYYAASIEHDFAVAEKNNAENAAPAGS
ncbi:1-acyl-sn-glycerol-3-phosphate acyltransferase [Shimia ponticola]|uniref:1-acyl-sn-glycerol-3-phosphate acyltransferase n=1 Tax=Shimia ponticola TaxID=2582893 RepID=UPI0011BF8B83|nr:1-acyl-sn-glycerol-3-phosphate acyltransferase [Shimia ponticola]